MKTNNSGQAQSRKNDSFRLRQNIDAHYVVLSHRRGRSLAPSVRPIAPALKRESAIFAAAQAGRHAAYPEISALIESAD